MSDQMIEVMVALTYFKPSGKYYGDGRFKMAVKNLRSLPDRSPNMPDIFQEVEWMAAEANLPGLNPGAWEGPIHVACEGDEGYPGIVFAKRSK